MLLVSVLYVNQEMVLRLGDVTGVGHARLILEYVGIPKAWAIVVSTIILMAVAGTADFRRFERFASALVFGS